jgi:serine/threonine protein kinase
MEARPDTHPSEQTLKAYRQGMLHGQLADTVAGHLRECPACRDAGQPPDSPTAATVLPSPPAESPTVGENTSLPFPLPEVPPELAGHSKYRIVRELGRGGMGVVYQAVQTLMDRPVAIKVINPSILAHPSALPRFQAEVKAAARLDHPNIVRAYDAEQIGNLHLLVMEYVDGISLATRVRDKGPVRIIHACHYVRQAALGLQHAFERGMAHRDIKPSNLMRTANGQVKILDFGLARLREAGAESHGLTATGAFMGTPEYVAPEQAEDARKADIRSDIYSLGCTLYFLLTGRPPFEEQTAVQLIIAHIEKKPPAIQTLRPDVPKELATVLANMLEKNPAKRYQTPADVAKALAPFTKPEAGRGGDVAGVQNTAKDGAKATAEAPPMIIEPRPADANLQRRIPPPSDGTRRPRRMRRSSRSAAKQRWVIASIAAAGLLMLGLFALWAGGVFKVKTKEGILVVETNEPNPEVYVDGEQVTVSWKDAGTKAEIRVKPGTHKVEVKKDGLKAYGEQVTLEVGGRQLLSAHLIPPEHVKRETAPPTPPAKSDAPPSPRPPTVEVKAPATAASVAKPPSPGRFPIPGNFSRPIRGIWEIDSNELVQRMGRGESRITFGDVAWTDYDFSVEAKRTAGNDGFGLWTRARRLYVNACLFSVAGHSGNRHYIAHTDGPNIRELATKLPGFIENGQWYTALVKVRGKRVQCFLDNVMLFDVEARFALNGCVCLSTWESPYRFRNIKVMSPDGKVLLEGLPDLSSPSRASGP